MQDRRLTERDLRKELNHLRESYPNLPDDQLFVLWFVQAWLIGENEDATRSLTGGPNDGGVDAISLDHKLKTAFLVQGKYHQKVLSKTEKRADVLSFAQLADRLTGEARDLRTLTENLDPNVRRSLEDVRLRLVRDKYRLKLIYATTGRCSLPLQKEAFRLTQTASRAATFELLDGRRILRLLADYLGGVAPPVPSLDLDMTEGHGVQIKGIFHRFDYNTSIESWVFSMGARAVAELFSEAGDRLFSRNVRGFLGSNKINRGMEGTLQRDAEHFWYYNNGITIICDRAEEITSHGRTVLRVENPQVINGQQTTRMLSRFAGRSPRASVLVRVTSVPRGTGRSPADFESLVSRIVAATNSQDEIRASDLMSNDRRQIEIGRELRKLGYYYIRKRQTKGEARRAIGAVHYYTIRKDELAQAVAACELDPLVVREGKEGLFEERLYGLVFPTPDPYFFLSRYWLMREVAYASKGFPERAYAKWLVLNFMWSQLAPRVRARAAADVFRRACEKQNSDIPVYLNWAINSVYRAALRFYRLRRGKGAKAIDISTFFKRKRNQHLDFRRFWAGGANIHRAAFRRNWRKFEVELARALES